MCTKKFTHKMPLVHQAWLALFLVAIGLFSPFTSSAQGNVGASLPQLGDGSEMPSSAERRIGDRIARELYRDPDYIDDPVLGDYVQNIWQPLLAAARARGDLTPELDEHFAWQVMMGRDRSVNAFALPGGYLGLHLGLLAVVSNRDELASVLGHELSHVTQRHIARMLAKSGQQAPWMIGAMILGALAASKNADAGNALMVGGQALSAQSQLNFSRDMEREADRVGLGVMTQAGFESQGFVTMFDKLQQASRLNDNGAYPYLRSHPLTTERIADMQSRLPSNASHTTPTGSVHAMMASRARVLSNPAADALLGWQDQVKDAGLQKQTLAKQAGVWYGAALAASNLRLFADARQHLKQLKTLVATDAGALQQANWLMVEIALAARDLSPLQLLALGPEVGLDMAQGSADRFSRTELLLQAQIAIQARQKDVLALVGQRLQTWVTQHPTDSTAWQALSGIFEAQGQSLRALRAEAESWVARLDYVPALDRLRAARTRLQSVGNTSANRIEASIIDARFRQIEKLRDVHE